MPDYRRMRIPGGTYFFTVNLLERYPNDLLVRHIDALRESVRQTRERHPFHVDAWVVLPDHLHAVWTLPEGDADFANRWRTIKQHFSPALDATALVIIPAGKPGAGWSASFTAGRRPGRMPGPSARDGLRHDAGRTGAGTGHRSSGRWLPSMALDFGILPE